MALLLVYSVVKSGKFKGYYHFLNYHLRMSPSGDGFYSLIVDCFFIFYIRYIQKEGFPIFT